MNLKSLISPFRNYRNSSRKERITQGGNVHRGTLVINAPQRFGIGLDTYMEAIRSAENVDYTQRTRLYDIYNDTLLDPHLFAVAQKRKAGTLKRRIEFRRDGVPDDKVNDQISSPWFLRFIEDALDALLWGFTLVQFYINEKGWIDYFNVPRKHVDPVLGVIKTRQSDIIGVPFDTYPDLLMVKGKEPLGILARTAPYVIYKRGSMGDWAQFSEIFGMPVRKYTYDAADPESRAAAMDDAMNQGSASVFLCPEGTNLEFIEAGNKTGSAEVYASLIERCNAEMSKAVLGNTLTTEASETGTQALGTVHSKVEDELVEQDGLFILNLLNYEMTDIFAALGVNTEGGVFVFVEEEELTLIQKAELMQKAQEVFHLPMSDEYLYKTLGIEKPQDYDRLKALSVIPDDEKDRGNTKNGKSTMESPKNRFFDHAPQGDGALEW